MAKVGNLLVIIFLLSLVFSCHGRKLMFANVVWRHGDRSFILSYPNDPYKDKNIWPNGLGQLTETGMKEQYELGRFLRSRYDKILNKTYNRAEIYIRSTDKDRTLMSAETNMAGLYPPTDQDQWNGTSTAWHPIPIHTVSLDEDKLLRYPMQDCPKYFDIMKKIKQSSWYKHHEKDYAEFYESIQNFTGSPYPYNLTNIWQVEDNLFCLASNNFTLPEWASKDVMAELKQLNSLGMGLYFTDIEHQYRGILSQMQGGTLLKKIISNMKNTIEGKMKYSMIAYSAHDTTLTALLVSMGNYDWIQPPYASAVMLELYEDSGEYFVETYYRNTTSKPSIKMKFYDCDLLCPFEQFVSISKSLTTDDRDKLCGIDTESYKLMTYIWLLISVSFVLAIIIVLALFFLCRKDQKQNYEQINSSEEDVPI